MVQESYNEIILVLFAIAGIYVLIQMSNAFEGLDNSTLGPALSTSLPVTSLPVTSLPVTSLPVTTTPSVTFNLPAGSTIPSTVTDPSNLIYNVGAPVSNIKTPTNETLKSADLLPQYNDADIFSKQNPVTDLLQSQNYVISGYHMGIDTVLQSNKIQYHDLRSAPPIPKQNIGPWSQSSYEDGPIRRKFELGV